MDGLSTAEEAVRRAAEDGSPALAITDHGTCAGHWQHQAECDKAGIVPVFGLEAYFRPDRRIRPAAGDKEGQKSLAYGDHLILLARDDQGLHDMWLGNSEAHRTGFYFRPRWDWDLLEERGSHLIATTSCLGGIISKDLLAGFASSQLDDVLARLDRLKALFPGRLYLEIQANELPEQKRLNMLLAELGPALGIPLVAACDAHYPAESDGALHKLWMMCQTGKQNEGYWNFSPMLSERRTREVLGYLDPRVVEEAIRNTGIIAEQCSARIGGHFDPPVFTRGGTADDDSRRLLEMCYRNWGKVPDTSDRRDRLAREFDVVSSKGLAGCYLMVEDLVTWVRSQGILVGPGRGSAAGSLMSYLLGITSIDPIPAGLLFERFLTPGRAALPDFDLDFPSSKRTMIQDHVVSQYGESNVVRVGTVMRYGAKGILNKLFSVMSDRLPPEAIADGKTIAKLIDEAEIGTAGLGLPWDEIVSDRQIAEFAEKYSGLFAIAHDLHGRLYSYGKHPAGLIISPERSLEGVLPMRLDTGSKMMVSEFGFREAEELGLLKLDCLTIRTLDSVQMAIELVEKRTGRRLDPREWDAEHDDPQVWDEIDTGRNLGTFQIETSLCEDYTRRHRPRTIGDLADLTTYIRPGPRNSGATEHYLARRSGSEPVTYPHPLLEEHLGRSYGVLLYQEDILTACRVLGGYSDLEADGVRKILGKKLTEKIEAAGEEFIRRCTERGHDKDQVTDLWSAMAEFGKYAFNRAHGYSYATLSYWTAWIKVHYPVEMLTAILSTLKDGRRMAEFATEARRLGNRVLPPDARFSGSGFEAEGVKIRYGLSAIPQVGPAAIASIRAHQPYGSLEDFRRDSGADAGVLYALAKAGALDPLVPSRRGLVRTLEADRDGSASQCIHKDLAARGPGGLPCTFDWAGEPPPAPRISPKTGKALKVYPKPVPRRCTVACRHYTPPEVRGLDGWPEYTPAELFRAERETYGCWMSEAPFEQLDQWSPGMREQSRRLALAVSDAGPGTYPLAAVYGGHHTAITRNRNTMWWVTLVTEAVIFDMACFSPRRDEDPDLPAVLRTLREGQLIVAEVTKRRYTTAAGALRTGYALADIRTLR